MHCTVCFSGPVDKDNKNTILICFSSIFQLTPTFKLKKNNLTHNNLTVLFIFPVTISPPLVFLILGTKIGLSAKKIRSGRGGFPTLVLYPIPCQALPIDSQIRYFRGRERPKTELHIHTILWLHEFLRVFATVWLSQLKHRENAGEMQYGQILAYLFFFFPLPQSSVNEIARLI